ncbi:MAG TPA: hypothetical protein VGE83_05760 [Terracidiphilus sp.]|jgi:hypothetical protein
MDPISRSTRFAHRVLTLWKWCLSYRKRDWELADYPVIFRTQEPGPADEGSRFKTHRYVASIENWHLTGTGDSRAKALENLHSSFAAVELNKKEKGELLPRPGTRVPIEFASQERVNAYPELADDFIQRVLGLQSAWISDESSLWDFHSDETNDFLYSKIKETYGVDVSDIESAKLCEILERIAAVRKPA